MPRRAFPSACPGHIWWPSEGLAELARQGVTLSLEEAWDQYHAYSFQTLMTSVVSLGLGTVRDMDEVLEVILGRSVGAIRRVGFGDWLTELTQ